MGCLSLGLLFFLWLFMDEIVDWYYKLILILEEKLYQANEAASLRGVLEQVKREITSKIDPQNDAQQIEFGIRRLDLIAEFKIANEHRQTSF